MPVALLVAVLVAQPPAVHPALAPWQKLPTPKAPGKQDDLHFVSPERGWYVNGSGRVFRTADGGATWAEVAHKPGTYFRCVGFLDDDRGFAGNIGPDYFPGVTDPTPLYRTLDGGTTWTPVAIAGDPVKGLCALQVARWPFIHAGELGERLSLFGGGRVGGPAVLVQSRDGGGTWTATDLGKHAGMVLDVHWFDDRTAVVAAATDSDVRKSEALVLRTADAGATWQPVYKSGRPFELTWKLSFPTPEVGYCTVQSYDPDKTKSKRYVAKTLDGGRTWAELPLVDDHKVREFGVGFSDPLTGWVGAVPGGFGTVDGGKTWAKVDMGPAANKVRVLPTPTGCVAFAVGLEVRKLVVPAAR